MTDRQLDLGVALLLKRHAQVVGADAPTVMVQGQWSRFSPTSNWDDYGTLILNIPLAVAAHAVDTDPDDEDIVTQQWFDCHAYYGSTFAEGTDLRRVVCQSAVRLLDVRTRRALLN